MSHYENAAHTTAIEGARARARAGLQNFFNNNISTLSISINDVTQAEQNIATIENIANWEKNQIGWWNWFTTLMTQSGHYSLDDFIVPTFSDMISTLKSIGEVNVRVQNLLNKQNKTEGEKLHLSELAGQMQGLFESLLNHASDYIIDTTLSDDVSPNNQAVITPELPLLDIFTAADDINTPFVGLLRTSFIIHNAEARVSGLLAVQDAIKQNTGYFEIPTRIKLKLNEAMLEAVQQGEPITVLQGYITNSRANLRQGGYIPAEIYKDRRLSVATEIQDKLTQIHNNRGNLGLPNTIGYPAVNASQQQKDVVLYLQRWCNQGKGVDVRAELMDAKLQSILDALTASNANEYNERVRKLIKYITLSSPNSVPMTKEQFSEQIVKSDPGDIHTPQGMSKDDDDEDVEMKVSQDGLYNDYITTWHGSIWRTRQNLYVANPVQGGPPRIPGPVLNSLGLDENGNQILPLPTMETNLLSVFHPAQGANILQGIYLHPQNINGQIIGGRRKSRRRRRKRKKRKSRKKKGGRKTKSGRKRKSRRKRKKKTRRKKKKQ